MRKWSVLCFFAVSALTAGLFACGFSTVGTDPDGPSPCKGVLRKHVESMEWHMHLTCKFQEPCESEIVPFVVLKSSDTSRVCYDRYEYTFNDGRTKKKVTLGTTVPVTVDDDDHVRFSLFDSEKVEKTYDIDLSEIIHSYTVKDDSVEIKMPEGSQVNLYLKDSIVELFEQKIPEGLYSFSVSTPFDKYYYFDYSIVYETEMLSDVINVYGRIYWRE